MQDVVLAALFVIDHELQGDPRAVRPIGIGRRAAIADHVARIGVVCHGKAPWEIPVRINVKQPLSSSKLLQRCFRQARRRAALRLLNPSFAKSPAGWKRWEEAALECGGGV